MGLGSAIRIISQYFLGAKIRIPMNGNFLLLGLEILVNFIENDIKWIGTIKIDDVT